MRQVFKNGPSKIVEDNVLKNLLAIFLNTLPKISQR